MNAIKCEKVWGRLNFFDKSVAPDAIEALVDSTSACHRMKTVTLPFPPPLPFFFAYLGTNAAPRFRAARGGSRALVSAELTCRLCSRAKALQLLRIRIALTETAIPTVAPLSKSTGNAVKCPSHMLSSSQN